MNFNFGGKGGKLLRDTLLTEDSVGNDNVPAVLYETVKEGSPSTWSLTKPSEEDGVVTKEHDCRVCAGDTQVMSFEKADTNPPPPFYALKAPQLDTPVLDLDGKPMTKKKKQVSPNSFLGIPVKQKVSKR